MRFYPRPFTSAYSQGLTTSTPSHINVILPRQGQCPQSHVNDSYLQAVLPSTRRRRITPTQFVAMRLRTNPCKLLGHATLAVQRIRDATKHLHMSATRQAIPFKPILTTCTAREVLFDTNQLSKPRHTGRPPKTWLEYVRDDLSHLSKLHGEIGPYLGWWWLCRDRNVWTKKIRKVVTTHTESSDWKRVTILFYSKAHSVQQRRQSGNAAA
jgi:hypothetical protein